MTEPASKFLFDECALGKPAVDSLAALLSFAEPESRAEITHKLTFHGHGPGIWDEQWVPEAGAEGWVIISADRGKKGGTKKGQKLPRVCEAHCVTHVLLSGGMMRQKQFDKLLAILSVWYDLLRAAKGQRGVCYMLEPKGRGVGTLRTKRIPDAQSPPPPPGLLF